MTIYYANKYMSGYSDMDIDVPEVEIDENSMLSDIDLFQLESVEEDHALFEEMLKLDYTELSFGESAVEALLEENKDSVFNSIKQKITDVWAKIKKAVKDFAAKISAFIMRDTKKMVSKYTKEIHKKNLSNFSYNYAEDTGKIIEITNKINDIVKTDKEVLNVKVKDVVGPKELKEELVSDILGEKIELKDFKKKLHELCFNKAADYTGMDSSLLKTIEDELTNNKKTKEDLKKLDKEIDKAFKNQLKGLATTYKKTIGNRKVDYEGKKAYGSDVRGGTILLGKFLNAAHSALTMVVSGLLREHKFRIKQYVTIYKKLVNYSPSTTTANTESFDFIFDDITEFEME